MIDPMVLGQVTLLVINLGGILRLTQAVSRVERKIDRKADHDDVEDIRQRLTLVEQALLRLPR